jgi:hypothetical protein
VHANKRNRIVVIFNGNVCLGWMGEKEKEKGEGGVGGWVGWGDTLADKRGVL